MLNQAPWFVQAIMLRSMFMYSIGRLSSLYLLAIAGRNIRVYSYGMYIPLKPIMLLSLMGN